MTHSRTRTRSAFTLVELLVVVLILSTLMAIALPLYLSSLAETSRRACRANLQSMANAAHAWKVKNRYPDFNLLTLSGLTPDLGTLPTCPDGGEYSIATSGSVTDEAGATIAIPPGSFGVSCSFPSHHGYIPGVMAK